MGHNQLTGSLPSQLPPKLLYLNFTQNNLTGSLPAEFGLQTQLRQLDLSNNSFSRGLPPEWAASGAFQALIGLTIEGAGLTDALPHAWGHQGAWPALQLLWLDGNNFSGTLPDSWASAGAFPQLRLLALWSSSFNGRMPSSWGSASAFPSLQVLELSHSSLCGEVPASHNQQLGILSMHDCSQGLGVDDLWNSTAPLQAISMANSSISGWLPAEPTGLKQLAFLDLNHNQMKGPVPLSWLQV